MQQLTWKLSGLRWGGQIWGCKLREDVDAQLIEWSNLVVARISASFYCCLKCHLFNTHGTWEGYVTS